MLQWNKALSDSWCIHNKKVFLWFANVDMAKWKENLEVCQKSPGALIQAPSNPLRIKGIIVCLKISLQNHDFNLFCHLVLEYYFIIFFPGGSSHKFKINFSFIFIQFNSSLCWTLFLLHSLCSSQGQISLGTCSLGAPSLCFPFLTQNTSSLPKKPLKIQENRSNVSQSSECFVLVQKVLVFTQLLLSSHTKLISKLLLACFKHSVHLFLIYMYYLF